MKRASMTVVLLLTVTAGLFAIGALARGRRGRSTDVSRLALANSPNLRVHAVCRPTFRVRQATTSRASLPASAAFIQSLRTLLTIPCLDSRPYRAGRTPFGHAAAPSFQTCSASDAETPLECLYSCRSLRVLRGGITSIWNRRAH